MKRKTFVSSLVVIAICLTLIVGSTFALFTSETGVNSALTAGNVEFTAIATNFTLSSTLGSNVPETWIPNTDTNEVEIERIVPGDVITFDIVVENKSDITVNFRTIIKVISDDGLWDGLVVTIGNETYDGTEKIANWASIAPTEGNVTIPVTITLPEDRGNEYKLKKCTFVYNVEAIQGNAPVTNP